MTCQAFNIINNDIRARRALHRSMAAGEEAAMRRTLAETTAMLKACGISCTGPTGARG
ncbi:hypothetical protein WCX72_09830 [Sulfurimonas sp. HSL1-6]|uniref:hypothetical protein n=1 Tax=Sulfurimonadaceae TaxID=2771471 RepID=UPI0031F983BB